MSNNVSTAPGEYSSSVLTASLGKKTLMAVSGVVWVVYVIGHMAGNLQFFLGPDAINAYAMALRDMGPLLWLARIVFAGALIVHVWSGILVWAENKKARPVPYAKTEYKETTLSSRWMIYTGIFLFLFIIYHVLHYTLHITNPEYATLTDSKGQFDVYTMMVMGFSNPVIAIIYILGMIFLALHLKHAIKSMFQTIGWNNPDWRPRLRIIAATVAIVVAAGFISLPLSVWLGLAGGGN